MNRWKRTFTVILRDLADVSALFNIFNFPCSSILLSSRSIGCHATLSPRETLYLFVSLGGKRRVTSQRMAAKETGVQVIFKI